MAERSPARIAGVVLAAGASKRLGAPKQLVELDGETLLARSLRIVRASRCDRVAVVLGAHRDLIAPGVAVEVIENAHWAEGMASSVRAAAHFARDFDGLLLVVCDQPRLTTKHLDELIATFERENRTIGSRYARTIGVPAIFERARFGELARLEGDRGARALLRGGNVGALDWPDGAIDLDTRAEVSVENERRISEESPTRRTASLP